MKAKNKVLLTTLCAAALVAGTVLGTMAYLTDKDEVENTFTVGSVNLGEGLEKGLDEAKVNEYGERVDTSGEVYEGSNTQTLADRVQKNTYKLVPGHKYIKDPTVHVKNDSEKSYIFITVDNGLVQTIDGKPVNIEASSSNSYTTVAGQIAGHEWSVLQDSNDNYISFEGKVVYYKEWTKPLTPEGQPNVDENNKPVTTGTTDLIVFDEFKVNGEVDKAIIAKFENKNIVIKAYAVQMDGFDSAAEAWTTTFGKRQ